MTRKKFGPKMAPEKELEELEHRLKILYEQRDSMMERIEQLKSDKELPGLKKKYEGKYFKFNNGYNSQERWWLYVHVREIKSRGHFLVSRFETTTDGKSEFGTQIEYSTSLFQVPITKFQYAVALKKFRQQLNKL